MYEEYKELVRLLKDKAEGFDYDGWVDTAVVMEKAANAIEKLVGKVEQLSRWIPVTERLPEESEGLDWHEGLMIRFTSVWCYDVKTGTIEVRNRYQGKMTGNESLDQYTEDTDWHWSKSWWEPTHWMPRVLLQEPPEEEEND